MSVDDERMREIGVTEPEVAAINDAIRRTHARFTEQLRAAYLEATGDSDGAGTLSPRAILEELEDKALPGESSRVRRALAEERAGLRPRLDDLSAVGPSERGIRLLARQGDEMQAVLAQSLGAERAHAIRASQGGWPWGRSRHAGCDDE